MGKKISRRFVLHPDEAIISVNAVVQPTVTPEMVSDARRYGLRANSRFAAMIAATRTPR